MLNALFFTLQMFILVFHFEIQIWNGESKCGVYTVTFFLLIHFKLYLCNWFKLYLCNWFKLYLCNWFKLYLCSWFKHKFDYVSMLSNINVEFSTDTEDGLWFLFVWYHWQSNAIVWFHVVHCCISVVIII